jgi:hypothetical protein
LGGVIGIASRGLAIAALAARCARRSPIASPVPIIAVPISLMIGSNVREVEIDEALFDHQVSNAGDARAKHLIGHRESVSEGVSSRRDKRHKRCQSPQPLGQAPEPRPDVGGAREAITPALHVVGGGELNQRPQAAKRCAILLGNPGDRLDFASGEQSGFGFPRTLNVGFVKRRDDSRRGTCQRITGGAHAKE